MGKRYNRVNSEKRVKIHQLLLKGVSIEEIAVQLRYHHATLYRELTRNFC